MNNIICAIDTKNMEEAIKITTLLKGHINMVKCGLEYFTSNGNTGIKKIASTGVDIFLDLKFHDIPNTVAEAVKSAVHFNVSMITIHILGGKTMMEKAVEAATEESDKLGVKKPLIIGVSILTSIDNDELNEIGIFNDIQEQVIILAKLAKEAGLDGIVCSSHEIKKIKQVCGCDFITVVPGIRPQSMDKNDQKRVATPGEAVNNGADYIVIGRPITQSNNPLETVKLIQDSMRI